MESAGKGRVGGWPDSPAFGGEGGSLKAHGAGP